MVKLNDYGKMVQVLSFRTNVLCNEIIFVEHHHLVTSPNSENILKKTTKKY